MRKRLLPLLLLPSLVASCTANARGNPAVLGGAILGAVGGTLIAVSDDPGQCSDDAQSITLGGCQVLEDWTVAEPYGLILASLGAVLGGYGLALNAEGDIAPDTERRTGRTSLERDVLRHADAGRCRLAVEAHRKLQERDPAAAARVKLDDDVRTCLIEQDARESGLVR
jgi:hypothetical protein